MLSKNNLSYFCFVNNFFIYLFKTTNSQTLRKQILKLKKKSRKLKYNCTSTNTLVKLIF